MLNCPKCGSTAFRFAEDTTVNYRCLQRANNSFVFESYAVTDDEAENQRFRCDECGHEMPVPPSARVNFK